MFYLDNVDFGPLNADNKLRPRYKNFSYEILKNLVNEDKIENGTSEIAEFGRTKVQNIEYDPLDEMAKVQI